MGIEQHGIRVVFVQTGEVGRFDFPSLLVTLVSGLALLAGANVATELLMTRILHAKEYYQDFKSETSVDFSEIRAELGKDDGVGEMYQLPSYTNFELTGRIRRIEDMLRALECVRGSQRGSGSFAFSEKDDWDVSDGEVVEVSCRREASAECRNLVF